MTRMKAFMLLVLLTMSTLPCFADRYALIVGINEYEASKALALDGCENDARNMQNVLVKKFGFASDPLHMRLLLSRQATRANVMAGLKWLATSAKPQDLVVFFFAGHGGQRAAEKDLNEPDGYDEVFLPYDMKLLDQSNDIVDDELDDWLKTLKTNNVVIVLDACHSGTGTRGLSGYTKPRDATNFRDPVTGIQFDMNPKKLPLHRAAQRDAGAKPHLEQTPTKGVLLAACKADSTALDIRKQSSRGEKVGYGLFSSVLEEELSNAPPTMTYQQLMAEVTRKVHAEATRHEHPQSPQIEGTSANRNMPIFSIGGEVNQSVVVIPPQQQVPSATTPSIPVPPPVTPPASSPTCVLVTQRLPGLLEGKRRVALDAGIVANVTNGSVYRVFPAKTSFNPTEAVGHLVITSTAQRTSEASVIAEKYPYITPGCKAVQIARNFGIDKLLVKVVFKGADPQQQTQAYPKEDSDFILAALSKHEHLGLVAGDGYIDRYVEGVREKDGTFTITVYTLEGGTEAQFKRLIANEEVVEKLGAALERAYVTKRLSALSNPTPAFAVSVRVNLVDRFGKRLDVDRGEEPVFYLGEMIKVEIKSTRDCFISVVQVGSSGKATLLFPNKEHPSAAVKSNEAVFLPKGFNFRVDAPTGIQTIKVFATEKPLEVPELNAEGAMGEFKSIQDFKSLISELDTKLSRQMTRDLTMVREEPAAAVVNAAVVAQNAVPLAGWSSTTITFRIEEKKPSS